MKFTKTLVLLGVAAIAAMALSATASATVFTDNNGHQFPEGTVGKSTNVGEVILDGTINIKCKRSLLEGQLESTGSSTETPEGTDTALTLEECGTNTVLVLGGGIVEVHTDEASANGNGILTSTGMEVTALTHNILGTVHCIYVTNETLLGTLDGSVKTGGRATYTLASAAIEQKATDFGCGQNAEMTAEYQVNNPSYVDVD